MALPPLSKRIILRFRRPNSTKQLRPARDSLFFKLPLEIRKEIYSYVVVAEDTIHVIKYFGRRTSAFIFADCGPINEDGFCDACEAYKNGIFQFPVQTQPLDIALLTVSMEIRLEVLDVIFLNNSFHFTHISALYFFMRDFEPFIPLIQAMSLVCYVQSMDLDELRLHILRSVPLYFRNLKLFQFYGHLIPTKPGQPAFNPQLALNFLRPLSRLKLIGAECHITWPATGKRPPLLEAVTIANFIARQGNDILMSNPKLPEQPQAVDTNHRVPKMKKIVCVRKPGGRWKFK